MAKRKLGASIIILCIAAVTLISGTYAWFLVGGTAELLDLGFGVMESTGGIELRGDEENAKWKSKLERADFTINSFITDKTDASGAGQYKPISPTNGLDFIYVSMLDHDFVNGGEPYGKQNEPTSPNMTCYNDFTFYIRSTAEEIVASTDSSGAPIDGAYMLVKLGSYKEDPDTGKPVADLTDDGAAHAARVAVTINDGTPTVYDVDGETDWNAVTNKLFSNGSIVDADPYNQIIDSADTGSANAGLTPVTVKKLVDDNNNAAKIFLGNIPNSTSNGAKVRVVIWVEGNDKECIDFTRDGKTSIAGKNLFTTFELHSGE